MVEKNQNEPRQGRRRFLVGLAASGVLIYVGTAVTADASAFSSALRRLGWTGTALILLLSLINYGVRFQRWTLYLGRLGHRLPVVTQLLVYLGGFAFTASPAKAGEAVRSVYLRAYGVSFPQSIAILFAERLLDLFAMTLLASLIALDHPAYWPVLITVMMTMLGLLVILGQPMLPGWIGGLAEGRSGKLATLLEGIAALLRSSQWLLKPRPLLVGLLMGLVAWGAEGIGFQLICRGLDLPMTAAAGIGIYAIATLGGGAAFFMPGGIGGMEAVMTSLLVARGAPLAVAVVATLLCRLATLWFGLSIGLIAAAILEHRTRGKAVLSA